MSFDRRKFLLGSGVAAGAAIGAGLLRSVESAGYEVQAHQTHAHGAMGTVGTLQNLDFDPYAYLSDFNWGDEVDDLGDGRARRIYDIVAVDKEIEIAPGVTFPAWTYNGQVPGPTLRANEGDELIVRFSNSGSHPHTIHFHGVHTPAMDGVPGIGDGMIEPGDSTDYTFHALPYGTHLYHCHATPLKRHIHKGLYGAFIIDPLIRADGPPPQDQEAILDAVRRLDAGERLEGTPGGTAPGTTGYDAALGEAHKELVMVMNGFDTNFDGGNEVYAVNSKAFAYMDRPIEVTAGELVRLFLVNITEFDPLNSFHLHAHFFDYYDTGRLENRLRTVDTIMQCQAQRGLLQFRAPYPGKLMFHAHQSEFAELGWMGFFEVVE